jgi:hypothetical protein
VGSNHFCDETKVFQYVSHFQVIYADSPGPGPAWREGREGRWDTAITLFGFVGCQLGKAMQVENDFVVVVWKDTDI